MRHLDFWVLERPSGEVASCILFFSSNFWRILVEIIMQFIGIGGKEKYVVAVQGFGFWLDTSSMLLPSCITTTISD